MLTLIQISIHALLAESDGPILGGTIRIENISIHALLAESDLMPLGPFLVCWHFYPRSPCGERQPPQYTSPESR